MKQQVKEKNNDKNKYNTIWTAKGLKIAKLQAMQA